ncbi:MAG: response regulator [Candidatus Altiarchaeota archaeon]
MAKVMVVDDDQVLSNVTKTVLEVNGFEVVTALNGQECLDKLRNFKPDVILLDIMMPGLSPKQVITQIRTRKLKLKIVYFSALKQHDETEKRFRENLTSENDSDYVVDYIEKPFTTQVLLDKIKKALE